ncbi:MAG TPA: sugar phosphate isomerase/epimerase family protein [Bryobacteraceae bacterium]|nr:sugar phosphate isomerase/epimerase family protein [Bryobacteraceae bacterium]
MRAKFDRRSFLSLAAAAAVPPVSAMAPDARRVRLALNVYSFNKPLRDGAITLPDVVDFCARHRIDALDATGYYFPGYPAAPPDDYIYNLKRKAFLNGIQIHGTGVRNDFAAPDPASRAADVRMVKDWIEVAAKLGASVIRVFSGPNVPDGHSFDQVLQWMVRDLQECIAHGRRYGIMVGLQHHNDFLKTADQTIRLVKAVDSEWFGVILDVGSLRQGDPYEEIRKLVPYAVSWQLKETVWYGGKETPIDLARLKAIIDSSGYRGFLPIETLGGGDPRTRVAGFLGEVRKIFPA